MDWQHQVYKWKDKFQNLQNELPHYNWPAVKNGKQVVYEGRTEFGPRKLILRGTATPDGNPFAHGGLYILDPKTNKYTQLYHGKRMNLPQHNGRANNNLSGQDTVQTFSV